MRKNILYTKVFIVSIFTILSQNIVFGQCPPSANSTGNTTEITIDTGENPMSTDFFPVFMFCTNVANTAASTIDVTFEGVTTTFSNPSFIDAVNGTCRIAYENATANPEIIPPFSIVFSDNPMESCTYAAGGVLPVEMARFDVSLVKNEVVLNWETVEELNNDYFEILRSNDAKEWESIGTVSGAGTTSQRVRYDFVDETASLGENYYVLVQTDYDGRTQFSRMQVISLKGGRNHISLYPNPASQNITVEVAEDSNFPLNVNIFDATGRLVAVHQLLDYSQTLNIDELDKGFYHLQVNSRNASISERFVKQ